MKKPALVTLFCLTTLGYHTPLMAEDFKPSSNIVTLMPIVMDNLDTLELSSEQLDQIRAISRQNFSKVESINAEYHHIKTELKEELLNPENQDNQYSRKLLAQLLKLEEQRMTLTLECTLGLKKILPAEKFKEILSLLEFQSS